MLMSSPFLPPDTRTHRPRQATAQRRHAKRDQGQGRKHTHHQHRQEQTPQDHAGPRPAARHRSSPSHHDQHARQGKTPHRRQRQRSRQQQRQPIGRNARPTVTSQGFSTTSQRATSTLGAGGPAGALCLARAVEDGPALEAASRRPRRCHGPRARLGRPL